MDLRTNYQTKKLQERIAKVQSASNDQVSSQISENLDSAAMVTHDGSPFSGEENLPESDQPEGGVLQKFAQLYEENPDFAGWLRIPGTKIDYPVMSRAGDNNYYLDKNFEQQHDKNGSLILDYRNDISTNGTAVGQNLIIYGHNMRTGVMFGTLKDFKEKSFCDEHRTTRNFPGKRRPSSR